MRWHQAEDFSHWGRALGLAKNGFLIAIALIRQHDPPIGIAILDMAWIVLQHWESMDDGATVIH
ncbi:MULTISPECIES: hypothetical protein [Rhizobium]|uniref:Uncharacterized protein n=1 Tax=Rhizobium favelukesii TaxID=348824 RepID=W6RZE8_9HYPH|nr:MULTISPECIES: hypothetical protein [Rhizobium]MCA0803665.1 hypothetical protein [Rhizobium sp. T1473]MCS0459419.1 hypothetical protein [Rhizobium favelukesii]CDM59651.1 putative predicted protein [Rhizobium favelukesii]